MYTSVLPLRKARSQQETIKTSQVNYKLQPEHKSEVNEKKKKDSYCFWTFILYTQPLGVKEEELKFRNTGV